MQKNIIFVIVALLLGFIGFSFIFSDSDSGESWTSRILIITLFFFLSGLIIGFFNPKGWIISGLTALGGVIFGGILTVAALGKYGINAFGAQEPPYISAGLFMLFVPLVLSVIGGYVGKLLGKKFGQNDWQLN